MGNIDNALLSLPENLSNYEQLILDLFEDNYVGRINENSLFSSLNNLVYKS